jgi:chromosome segregation ATPase
MQGEAMPQKVRSTLQSVNENVLEILRRLDGTDSRIDYVHTTLSDRIDQVQSTLGDRIDQVQSTLSDRIDHLEGRIDSVETTLGNRIDRVETKLDGLQTKVDKMAVYVARIPVIEARLDAIETRLKALEVRMANLEGLYEHHDKKLEILDHEYVALTAGVKRLEQRFDKLEADALRDRVRVLEEKVAALERNTLN